MRLLKILNDAFDAMIEATRQETLQRWQASPEYQLIGQPFEGGEIIKCRQLADGRFLATVQRGETREQVILSESK